MNYRQGLKLRLLACTAIAASGLVSTAANAQDSDDDRTGLDIIIVEAQKREQSIQDVPIAVSAIGEEALKANRVNNVVDLSGLAPGVTIRMTAGGANTPTFSMRGLAATGVTPGSDRQVALYLDGVYIQQSRGSIFEFPDVQRIEVLRGPQGTLFGRNATAGAISISTRDPTGDAGVEATGTIGNQDHYRFRLTANTPQIGPFSAYFSYVHEERRGDIRNLGAGAVWDRTIAAQPRVAKITRSPEWLGSKFVDSYFAAVKFESGDFSTVYKYDRSDDKSTPEAVAITALNTSAPLIGPFLGALVNSQAQPVPFASVNKRPDAVRNDFAIPSDRTTQGHSLTSTWVASDNITVKNILGYRKSFGFSTSPLDGFSSLRFTPQALIPYATFAGISSLVAQGVNVQDPANGALIQQTIGAIAGQVAPLIGQPIVGIASAPQYQAKQTSAELQVNYDSDFVTATAGALFFKSEDSAANPLLQNTISFDFIPGGVFTRKKVGRTYNEQKSYAAYLQAELHLTPQLDVILGGRVTRDDKISDLDYNLGTLTSDTDLLSLPRATFKDTRFDYLVGVNYKPTDDILLYAKYSTAYVSGGTVAGIDFVPETVKSAEAGFKGEFLNRRLRTNLAVYWAKYSHLQGTQSVTQFPQLVSEKIGVPGISQALATFIFDNGTRTVKGIEFDFDAAPLPGLTLGGNIGYFDPKTTGVDPAIVALSGGTFTGQSSLTKLTGGAYIQYETPPLFGESYVTMRLGAKYFGDNATDNNPNAPIFNFDPDANQIDAYWLLDGRIALKDVDLGGVNAELGLWGRNLLDEERLTFGLNLSNLFFAANYIPARSYGLDLTVKF